MKRSYNNMTSKKYLILPDPHAHKDHDNKRADWIGKLILDERPDVVMNMGDTFDMPSLSSFDKGKASFHGASYEKDIEAGVEFLDRMWHPIRKAKKKRPLSVFLEGNHEHRLKKVLEAQPELGGNKYGIGYKDYCLADYHNIIQYYEGSTPSIYAADGINFAHFLCSGVMGRPIGGDNHAASLLNKNFSSCVVSHSHLVDYAVRSTIGGAKVQALVAGVYQDYKSGWAGNLNNLWWRGAVILRDVEGGTFDPQFISIEALRRTYG
jgi:hypothetical protein